MGSLRFLLAFAVAAGHALGSFNFPNVYLAGGEAVQIFYMISGFLIALILRDKYADSASGNWIFYSNRAMKIFVPYLSMLGAAVVLSALFYAFTGNAVSLNSLVQEASTMRLATWLFALFTNVFIIGQEWAFLLVYRSGELFFFPRDFCRDELAINGEGNKNGFAMLAPHAFAAEGNVLDL